MKCPLLDTCSTFVVLPPLTRNGTVIFGKNSNQTGGEVQELLYEPSKEYSADETVKCTYIEVKQVEKTYAVILSRPPRIWGCEMGANDQGVVIGIEIVTTNVPCASEKTGLLGTDLVRLALERCKTSQEGVDIITKLIEEYGQGGCYDNQDSEVAHSNSFLLADASEAWILETAGNHWVAEKITSGHRNISQSSPTIGTNFDKISPKIKDYATENGLWNGEGDFNFAAIFGKVKDGDSGGKHQKGRELLEEHVQDNNFSVENMFKILRNNEIYEFADFPPSSSQVSVLSSSKPCCHWFTLTPNPVQSVFKPFIFTPNVKISSHTRCPVPQDLKDADESFDRRHNLYKLHSNVCKSSNNKVITLLQEMEQNCLKEVEKFLEDFQDGQSLGEVDELLKDVVETEVKFYS